MLIAGPTASGKSALAIKLARKYGGVIINADSMQVYQDLHVLTARPGKDQLDLAPHRLYGHLGLACPYDVSRWLEEADREIKTANQKGQLPIVVGGTGLYFSALLDGLAPVPPIPEAVRNKWRGMPEKSTQELYQILFKLDQRYAQQLEAGDRQRILRGLEVFEATGQSLLEWQKADGKADHIQSMRTQRIVLMPDRPTLHDRINRRFDLMIKGSAIEEVANLIEKNPDPNYTLMKAIGVHQIAEYLAGNLSLEQACDQAKAKTRQYAKRQCTWFNNRFSDWDFQTEV